MEVLNFPGQSGVSALLCLDFRIKVLSTALLLSDGQRKYMMVLFIFKDMIFRIYLPLQGSNPLCSYARNHVPIVPEEK